MGGRQSHEVRVEIKSLPKNLLVQLAFPQLGQKFQKAEFFYKTRQMKIHIPIQNQRLLKSWRENIQLVHEEQMNAYILLPKSQEFEKQSYCGSQGIAKVLFGLCRKIIYDYFPYSLEGQIANRKKSIDNQEFTEPELWKLLFTLAKAASLMHKHWKKIGDLRPKNVFYNEEKQLRLSSLYSYPNQLTNFQKFCYQKQRTYLAPQELQDIRMGRFEPSACRNAKQHIIEAESWSIGLTMLHVVLLFDFQIIYDPVKCEINLELLQQKIADLEAKKNISPALKNIVKSMLEQIPQRRLLSWQLSSNFLILYQQPIKKCQQFDATKLNTQIKIFMTKKAQNSLIGTIWKGYNTSLIESQVINKKQTQRLDTQTRAKQILTQQLEKFSQIQPKNSQVSARQSIRLGRSRKKLTESNVVAIKQSQVSHESFHTVSSMRLSVKNSNLNKIIGHEIQNRFGTQRLPTSGSHFSPRKAQHFENMSDKFMTPMEQSSYFLTMPGNEKSFDFNSVGVLNSTFRNSQMIQDKNFFEKINEKFTKPGNIHIQGNFKKQKSKQKK